ncbi:uncharacterized protein BDV17DRAFT_256382 [Aspergillus undulatus]|uniref:uncharacterized protein n=1 Tax=Aspergillus undulatus TaxID=1810928 RepID=UPI003CCDB4BC
MCICGSFSVELWSSPGCRTSNRTTALCPPFLANKSGDCCKRSLQLRLCLDVEEAVGPLTHALLLLLLTAAFVLGYLAS